MGGRLSSYLSHIRFRDAIIFQVPSLVGMSYAISVINVESIQRALLLALGGFLLMAHIFCFNDWSDSSLDSLRGSDDVGTAMSNGLGSRETLALALFLGIASLFTITLLSRTLTIIAAAAIFLGIVYSFPNPRFNGKGIPIFSSALHFTGTVLTFLLGYVLFSEIEARALLIGVYFGIIITAGHLVQEVKDYVDDRTAQISTNAVRFGPKSTFIAACLLFAFSFVYLFGLAEAEFVPSVLKYLLIFLPVLGVMAVRTYKAGLDLENVQKFRSQYRRLYAAIVLVMSASALIAS